jgi:hypothetical protein
MSTQTKNFLLSYGRSFLAAALAIWLANGADIWTLDLEGVKLMVNAGIAAVLPPLLRALNPEDPSFGKGFVDKKVKIVPTKKVTKRTTK